MKKKLTLLVIACVTLVQTSCEGDGSVNFIEAETIRISDLGTNIVIDESGKSTFSFTASNSWTISAADTAQWLTLSQMSGEKGVYNINIAADPNYDFDDRKTYFTLKSNNTEVNVSVFQEFGNGVSYINFPDEYFREYCLRNFDTDSDGQISIQEALKVKNIVLYDYNSKIESMKGIEFFSNLETIYFRVENLKELNLTRNPKLYYLSCTGNKLTRLDLRQNNALEYVDLYDNYLSELIFGKHPVLTRIYCYNNKLSSFEAKSLPKLSVLNLANNLFGTLDLSNCTNLTRMNVANNLLTTLDLSANTLLSAVYCQKNINLKEVWLSKGTSPFVQAEGYTNIYYK